MSDELPDEVEVRIEVSKGGFVKRRADGSVDFVSPVPCPFNYGSVIGTVAEDGDPLDAVVLGPALPRGTVITKRVWGKIAFVDAGLSDPKLVCHDERPTASQRRQVSTFFKVYAKAKRALNTARRARGFTESQGWRLLR